MTKPHKEVCEHTGKRSTRRSATGNLIGYISGRRWEILNFCDVEPFSDAEKRAEAAWLSGREDWREAVWTV